ncbi:uncharacterized protein LY89DRAFT_656317 [Mollisia scopiformis]|uniref:Ribosomal protein S21 n=1 Tax=Mollisia scopiformis TaxID=149040 RepID=A0A132BDK4_MOLSC|nr:uncharacterized protein LY89DRAFT_656317 [Mollisia scopiformis]KUJ10510.1 hypothetical protein LY89DRAFT_656317 [Mollisia scopiformis]
MEFRRAADVLLRSQTSPLATALNPRTAVRWTNKAQLDYSSCPNRPASRCLATSSRRYALKNVPTTTSAPLPQTTTSTTNSSSTNAPAPKSPFGGLNDSLGWISGNKSRSSFPIPRAGGSFEKTLNGGSSASDLLSGIINRKQQRAGGVQVDRMLDPGSMLDPDNLAKQMTFDTAEETMVHRSKRVPIKLGPSTGRSVTMGAGLDVGRGFRLLEQSCARNKVRADANKQRFHERGGLKRKRLRRERWRRKFMEGFKATVVRVKQLKNQGW